MQSKGPPRSGISQIFDVFGVLTLIGAGLGLVAGFADGNAVVIAFGFGLLFSACVYFAIAKVVDLLTLSAHLAQERADFLYHTEQRNMVHRSAVEARLSELVDLQTTATHSFGEANKAMQWMLDNWPENRQPSEPPR